MTQDENSQKTLIRELGTMCRPDACVARVGEEKQHKYKSTCIPDPHSLGRPPSVLVSSPYVTLPSFLPHINYPDLLVSSLYYLKLPCSRTCILFFFFFLIYFFLAVLGLRFCAWAFSRCGERGPLFIAVRGPLTVAASLVAEHGLQTRRLSSCGSRA